jgi:hypothetical protein
MVAKSQRPIAKSERRVAKSRRAKAEPRHRDAILDAPVDRFILTSFIEALVEKGYTAKEARARAKQLLAAPGFPGFPSPDAPDKR